LNCASGTFIVIKIISSIMEFARKPSKIALPSPMRPDPSVLAAAQGSVSSTTTVWRTQLLAARTK